MNIRPRGDWQSPSQPVVGPSIVLGKIELLPAHYTAASSVSSDTPSVLRAIQNDYTVNRGYSIGYNFAVDQTGACWELRGFDIKCAANKDMNDVTIAVLCLVDGADAMNPAMVDTFQALGAEAQRVCAAELLVVGHRDIGSTACPGDGIYSQVQAGQLEPAADPTPPIPPEPEPGDTDMASTQLLIHDVRSPEPRYKAGPTGMVWVQDGNALGQMLARVDECAGGRPSPVDGFVWVLLEHGGDDVIASYGPIDGDLPPGRDRYGRAT